MEYNDKLFDLSARVKTNHCTCIYGGCCGDYTLSI